MKFRYYEQYIVEGGKCIGIGEPVEENLKDFLKTQKSKGNTRLINLVRLSYNSIPSVMGEFPDEPEKLYLYFNWSYKEMPDKEVAKNIAISNLTKTYGPLGRNDFVKDENGVYVCNSFVFDPEWFIHQAKKTQRLYQAFRHYVGWKQRKDESPKRFKEIQDRLSKMIIEHFADSIEAGIEPTKTTIDDFAEHFTKEEIEYKKKMSIRYNNGEWRKIVTVNEHKDKKSLDDFMAALNDCMDNVRVSISAYEINGKIELRTDEYVPLNVFGAVALHIFDMYKKGMSMVTCEVCGVEKEMKKGSVPICSTCQNNRRQRKYSIKNSVKLGLSLNEIIEKHKKIPANEVKVLYSEIINESK